MPSQTSLLGSAGEHFVLSQLLRRGWIAALAPEGVPNTDIIITDLEGHRQFAVQVKTRNNKGSHKGWHMSKKHETLISDSLLYCFVDMGDSENDAPITYIIPSAVVAKVIKDSHEIWLRTPGKKGQAHNQTDFRRFNFDYSSSIPLSETEMNYLGPGWIEPYKENWEVLKQV